MSEKISAFVITKNEENKIKRCLEHLKWVDEIVIVDSFSTDKTVAIAKKFTKKIYKKKFVGYAQQKQAAIDKCTNNWILEIDADEIISDKLKENIQELCNDQAKMSKNAAYTITRQEYFLGSKLMKSFIPRLYRKDKVRYTGVIHETLEIEGKTAKIPGILIHESDKYETIADRITKNNAYTKKEVEKKLQEKKRHSKPALLAMMFLEPITYSSWIYLRKGVYKAGIKGIIWCMIAAYYHFLIYAKYYEHIYKQENRT